MPTVTEQTPFTLSSRDERPTRLPCPRGHRLRVRVDGGDLRVSRSQDFAESRKLSDRTTTTFPPDTPVYVKAQATSVGVLLITETAE
jgi:hypothetical protein